MSKSRLLSLIVAGIYILIAYFWGEAVECFTGMLGVSLPLGLACIWFGDALGGMQYGYKWSLQFSSITPGGFVKFVGWLLLILLPIIACMLQKSVDKSG